MADAAHEPHVRMEMLSQPRFLAAARAMVQHFAQRIGFSDNSCGQISLAVDEALCNVINHGYDRREDGRIWINLWALDGQHTPEIRIVIEDRARQVDPAVIKPRNLDDIRPGGLGVHIIREVMDEARYERREGGGMRLTMVKRGVEQDAATDSTATAPHSAPHAGPHADPHPDHSSPSRAAARKP